MSECRDCAHYGDHPGRARGTPPWHVCRFRLKPESCGRFQERERPTASDFDKPEHPDCPFCNDRTSYSGDPAEVFCDKHYHQYQRTF